MSQHNDGWLQSGSLLYRLTDGRNPVNRDEIKVTMSNSLRSEESCSRRASEILDKIREPKIQPISPDSYVSIYAGAIERMEKDHNLPWREALILEVQSFLKII